MREQAWPSPAKLRELAGGVIATTSLDEIARAVEQIQGWRPQRDQVLRKLGDIGVKYPQMFTLEYFANGDLVRKVNVPAVDADEAHAKIGRRDPAMEWIYPEGGPDWGDGDATVPTLCPG